MFDIRTATANAVERTQDPLAAIKLQEAYASVIAVGKMLTPLSNQTEVKLIFDRLVQDFPDVELDKANPALTIALCAMLKDCLVRIGRSFANDPTV